MIEIADLIGLADAARLKNMSYPNLIYYINRNRTPKIEVIGKRKYFHLPDIMAWEPDSQKTGRKPRKDI